MFRKTFSTAIKNTHLVVRRSVRSHHPLEGTILSCVVTCTFRKTFSTAVKHTHKYPWEQFPYPSHNQTSPVQCRFSTPFQDIVRPFWSSLTGGFLPSSSDSSPVMPTTPVFACLVVLPPCLRSLSNDKFVSWWSVRTSLKPSMTCHCDTCTLSMLTIESWLFPCVTDVQQNRVRVESVNVPWNTRGKCNDSATGQLVSGTLAAFCWWSIELLQTIVIVMAW